MIFKNKKAIAILGAAVITLGSLVILAPKIRTKLLGEMETVYKLKSNVEIGQKIEPGNIEKIEVSKSYVPQGVIKNKNDIVGKYVKTDIYKYDYITKEKLAGDKDQIFYGVGNLISVTLHTQPAGVSGQLQRGDVVRVLGYTQVEGEIGQSEVKAPEELSAIEVISVTNGNLQDINKEMKESKDTAPSDLPSTVILRVQSDEQAKKLVELEYGSKLHLVFQGRGEYAEKLLAEAKF